MDQAVSDAWRHARRWRSSGRVATYIPELANMNPDLLSVCMTDMEGNLYRAGDWDQPFTLQSIVKLILFVVATECVGTEKVFELVSMEPTGDPFNSIVRLETINSKPLNPMINAGAIATSSLITGHSPGERFGKVAQKAAMLLGTDSATYHEAVFRSEQKNGNRNRALAYMMKSNGTIPGDVDEHLEVYFKSCSIVATCAHLSFFSAVIANGGVHPRTRDTLIHPQTVRTLRALMTTCGMYDTSGQYAVQVGIPSKSGVGGGILGAVAGRAGIAVFSPRLDEHGSSYCGVKAMEYLSKTYGWSIF